MYSGKPQAKFKEISCLKKKQTKKQKPSGCSSSCFNEGKDCQGHPVNLSHAHAPLLFQLNIYKFPKCWTSSSHSASAFICNIYSASEIFLQLSWINEDRKLGFIRSPKGQSHHFASTCQTDKRKTNIWSFPKEDEWRALSQRKSKALN